MSFMCPACHARTTCDFLHMSGSYGPCEDCRRVALCVSCQSPIVQAPARLVVSEEEEDLSS